jgi:hypothetical protein
VIFWGVISFHLEIDNVYFLTPYVSLIEKHVTGTSVFKKTDLSLGICVHILYKCSVCEYKKLVVLHMQFERQYERSDDISYSSFIHIRYIPNNIL